MCTLNGFINILPQNGGYRAWDARTGFGSLKLDIKPFPSGNASAGRHDQHEGKTEDECVSPSHNGGYEYSRIVPKIGHFHWPNYEWGVSPFL